MPFARNCRDVTALVLAGEDRRLRWTERLAVRLHMQICATCPRFRKQVALMRQASAAWRAYQDSAGTAEAGDAADAGGRRPGG